jgi:hypothetical protein
MSLTSGATGLTRVVVAGAAAAALDKLVPDDSENIIGSVVTNSARQQVYSTGEWSGNGAWTTYYHSWQDAANRTQGWNMFLGDGYPNGTSQPMYSNDSDGSRLRIKEYTHGDRMGYTNRDLYYHDNVTNQYAGVTWRCMPVRNTTDASITKTLYTRLSTYNSNHGGGCIKAYTPNAGKYSAVSSGDWINSWQGGSNTENTERSGTVIVPANSTVLVMINSCHWYQTTYRFKDTNMPINLDDFFSGGLVCDLRMLEALATIRAGQNAGNATANPWEIYPLCATYYGDR